MDKEPRGAGWDVAHEPEDNQEKQGMAQEDNRRLEEG